MVSLVPCTAASYDYSYMYDLPDLSVPRREPLGEKKSVLALIRNNPDFSIFSYLVNLAQMDSFLNDPLFNGTVFVPSDSYLQSKNFPRSIIENMRRTTARAIVEYSILPERVPESVLRSSPACLYITRYNPCKRLMVENIRGITTLQECGKISVVHYNARLGNGIIHVIDGLLVPEVII